jgi:hypothetical protein
MRSKNLSLSFFLLLSGALLLAGQFHYLPQTERKLVLDPERSQELFQDGQVQFEIVCKPGNISSSFAAQELADYLGQALDSKLTVLSQKSGTRPALLVGDLELALAHGINPAEMDLDAYVIRSIGQDILLIGSDSPNKHPLKVEASESGSLFAVYDFLERFVGVRFYFPGKIGTIVPRLKEWSLPAIDLCERPDKFYRKSYDISNDQNALNEEYGSSYRLASLRQKRMMSWALPTTHGLAHNYLVERFRDSNPEYFALTDKGLRHDGTQDLYTPSNKYGHVCFSNAGLKEELFQDAKACLLKQPPATRNMPYNRWGPTSVPGQSFCLTPNDSMYPCRCEGCWKIFSDFKPPRTYQRMSDFIWQYVCDIAVRLQSENVPGYVTMFAYNPYERVPNVEIPANMLVQVCFSGPWAAGESQAKQIALLESWNQKLGKRPWLWNYCIQRSVQKGIPHNTPRTIGKFYQQHQQLHSGVFLETETERWHFGYLNLYVLSKVLWDVNTDLEALLAEHYQLMFAQAAPEMQEFFETLERHWTVDITANTVFTEIGPVTHPPSQNDLWSKIYSPAETARIDQLFAVAREKLSADPAALQRLEFIRASLWQPVSEAAEAYQVALNGQNELFCLMPEVPPASISPDGYVTAEFWETVPPVWLLPFYGGKTPGAEIAEVSTRVRTARDQNYLYFQFDAEEPRTAEISHKQREKDGQVWKDNDLEIFLNPSADRKTGFQILFNTLGCIQDLRFEPGHNDAKWDSGAECRISIREGEGWQAEIRLPRKSFTDAAGKPIALADRFPANFFRGRILQGQAVHYGYSWSPYVQQVHRLESYGWIGTDPAMRPANIIEHGDFTGHYQPGRRSIGKFITNNAIPEENLDRKVYRSGGVSIRMDDNLDHLNYYLTDVIKPNTRYKLSFQIKLSNLQNISEWKGSGGCYLVLGWGTGKNLYLPQNNYTGTMPWTRQEFIFQTPEKIFTEHQRAVLQLVRAKGRAKGTVWFDDFRLTELPPE